jgi:hypothetical protein
MSLGAGRGNSPARFLPDDLLIKLALPDGIVNPRRCDCSILPGRCQSIPEPASLDIKNNINIGK